MKVNHYKGRVGKVRQNPESEHPFVRDLASIVVLTLLWIGVSGYCLHWYQCIQTESAQLRRQCNEKVTAIKKLNDDIAGLDMDIEKLQSEPRIRLKIRQMGLNLRPTDPRQMSYLRITTPEQWHQSETSLTVMADRSDR